MSGICISRKRWSQRHLCLLLLAWETGKLDMLPSIGRWADRRLAPHPLWQRVSQLPTGIHRVIGRAGCLRSVAFEWVASSRWTGWKRACWAELRAVLKWGVPCLRRLSRWMTMDRIKSKDGTSSGVAFARDHGWLARSS
jgi:hypothetical protein